MLNYIGNTSIVNGMYHIYEGVERLKQVVAEGGEERPVRDVTVYSANIVP